MAFEQEEKDVIRLEESDRADLEALLKNQMFGTVKGSEFVDPSIGAKDSDGNMVWAVVEGTDSKVRSETVSELAGTGNRNIGVDPNGRIIELGVTAEESYIPLTGVGENKGYISKVDDNTISVTAGSGKIRKANLTEVDASWIDIPSQPVTILDGELKWCVLKWNIGETELEFALLDNAPVTLDDAEQYMWIGRIWKEGGVLKVGDRHIMLSVDPQVSRTNVWQFPSGNVSVTVHHATDVGLLSLSAGELTRWPVVESGTYHHVWKYSGLATVSSMWDHVQGSAGFTTISDNSAGDETDIRTIADYYDQNGNLSPVPQNDWVAHLIGVYAGSEERVLFRSQKTYAGLADAKLGISIDPLEEADWAKDLRQISKIGWMLVREGTRDFSDSARCVFVPYSLLGSGGGSGTTPNLEQVLGVGGDVDITDNLDTDRVMSFIKNGERILSVLGSGEVASALSSIADLRVGLLQVFNRFVSLGRSQFGNASDTGATISVVDQSGVAGELFTVDDFVSDTEGLYTLSAQVDADYGQACYEFTSGSGTTYYAYKGNVTGAGAYWFVGTTILTGNTAFTNCQYRSTQPVALPSALPSDAPAYDGVNAPDTAQQGVFQNQSGESKESINAETIVSKNTIGILSDTTSHEEFQSMLDSGMKHFRGDTEFASPVIPAGTYTLQGGQYFFETGYRFILGGDVAFNFPASPTGPWMINFIGEFTLDNNLTINNNSVPNMFDTLHVPANKTLSATAGNQVFYLSSTWGSGTINGDVTYQFKDINVTIGTGSIGQQNWKYPITQS